MELSIYTIEGKESGKKVSLSSDIFAVEKPSTHAIWQDVRLILANARQGTHKTKGRSEVAGSTKKLFRQKGTGNARQGSKRAPHHRHGGTVFGPVPHLYGYKMNKKLKQLARRSALTLKLQASGLMVVENFTFDQPKTKRAVSIFQNLKLNGTKTLLVVGEYDKNVYLSARNIPKTQVIVASDLSTYDIVHAEKVLLTEGAIKYINEHLS